MDLVDSFCRTQQTWTQSSSVKNLISSECSLQLFFWTNYFRRSPNILPRPPNRWTQFTNSNKSALKLSSSICHRSSSVPDRENFTSSEKFNLRTIEYFSIWTFRPTTDAKSARNCSKANERIGQANKSNKTFHHANSICIFAILPKESNILWTCFN